MANSQANLGRCRSYAIMAKILPRSAVNTPRTQKVISSSNGQLRDGEAGTLCLIFVLRGNIFMAHDALDQSGKGSAAERSSRPTSASCCTPRSGVAVVTRVRFVRASSISLPEGSLPTRSTSRSSRDHGAGHVEASTTHRGTAPKVREKQRSDYGSDRKRRVECVRTPRSEQKRSRLANSAACAGDDHDLVFDSG